jgi:hypothetical protein
MQLEGHTPLRVVIKRNLLSCSATWSVLIFATFSRVSHYVVSQNGDPLLIRTDIDLNIINIRELKDQFTVKKMTTLVVKGAHIDNDRLSDLREKGGWERLLPNLHSLSLPDFNGTILFECLLETE